MVEYVRETIEADLAETLEGEFALPVILISPSGVEYSLTGQVLFDSQVLDDDGNSIIMSGPVVTLRISSLTVVPQSDERWVAKIPLAPDREGETTTFLVNRAVQHGRSIGYLKLYLVRINQS